MEDDRYFLFKGDTLLPGAGEWSVEVHFGDRTYGIGQDYELFVIAVQTDSPLDQELAERPHGSSEPLPEGGLYRSKPIPVTRVGPVDHWYADYWDSESKELRFTEEIESRFLFRNWRHDAPSDKLPEDNWEARFVRRVPFYTDGPYRFYAERDDGVRIWVDGEPVISAWDEANLVRESQTVTLTQGYHEIAVDFFDSVGTATLGFWYEGPDPRPEPPPVSSSYWRVAYYPNEELRNDPIWYEVFAPLELDLYWGEQKGTPIGTQAAIEMLVDRFSTRSVREVSFSEGVYQFEVRGDTGVTFRIDEETLLIKDYAFGDCNPCRLRVDLSEGRHILTLEQWDDVLDARASLGWGKVITNWQSLSNPYVVRAMAADGGYVWTAGEGGLVRWNKRTLRPTQVLRSEGGLPDNLVSALLVDRGGVLWVGTGEGWGRGGSGLGRYDGTDWQTLTSADGLCGNAIYDLFQDQDGSLWVSTGSGLSHYDERSGEWRCYGTQDGLGADSARAVYRDSRGNLWVSVGEDEVSVLGDDGTWRTYSLEEIGLGTRYLGPIAEDAQGNIWFGSPWWGAARFDGQDWQAFTTGDGLPSDAVRGLVADEMGNVWFGTGKGVAQYDGREFKVYTTADGLASDDVRGLVIDRDDILWAGHGGDVGLSRFDGRQWVSSPKPEGTLLPNRITSIHQDLEGRFWVGTGFSPEASGDGVRTFEGTTWEAFGDSGCLPEDYIDVLFQDREGHLWFGYDIAGDGVTRFDGESCQTFTTSDGLAGDEVDDIIQDREGNLWFGTSDGGISRYGEQGWQTFDAENSELPSDDINVVFEDSGGTLWFGLRSNGLARYDGENWTVFTTTHGLASDYVTAIVEDKRSALWIGTMGDGISVYEPAAEKWHTYREGEDGLLSNQVYTIRVDSSGWVWVGTSDGVSFYTGRRWFSFTPADGLASRHVQAIWEDEKGNIWLGTGGGISQLQFVSDE